MAKKINAPKAQQTEQAGPPAVLVQVNPATAPAHASSFIRSEVNKFSRSHTRIYFALILDVIHAHAAATPKGYAAMLQTLAPHLTMLPKYCTVIAPALSSSHALTLADFPATVDGLNKAVAWYENQSSKAGYTLSLEDTVRFFKGTWSVKAQAEAKAKANETLNTQALKEAAEATARREAAGAAEATAQQAREAASNQRSKDTQATLEGKADGEGASASASAPAPLLSLVTPGPALGNGYESTMVVVHTKGEEVKVTGLESLSLETLASMMEAISATMQAKMESKLTEQKAA